MNYKLLNFYFVHIDRDRSDRLRSTQKIASSIMSSSFFLHPSLFFFFFLIVFCAVEASVPLDRTFSYVNEGDFQYPGIAEDFSKFRILGISNHPFYLCFHGNTPDSFILGLGMGNANSRKLIRWVWAANPLRPVSENAKLVFDSSGNLALVDVDGQVAWQTDTANKGVVDIKLLPNGNLVLVDSEGIFVFQSFDYPTDTLLVGQGLGPGISSTNKLVNGAYSMALEGKKQFGLFFKSPESPQPLLYRNLPQFDVGDTMTFNTTRVVFGFEPEYINELRFDFGKYYGWSTITRIKYNSTLSLLRLSADGNIHTYTYYKNDGTEEDVWEENFTQYSRNGPVSECRMPEKCSSLGLCVNNECVACPSPSGIMGWNRADCKPSKLPSCNNNSSSRNDISYYKIGDVDHFLSPASKGEGPMEIGECRKKCSNDCKCVAFFYDRAMCLITTQLNTLMMYPIPTGRVAYIKYAKADYVHQ